MTRIWGKGSLAYRNSICYELNHISDLVLPIRDHSIICGHRGEEDQHEAFTSDPQLSKLDWPDGKHNKLPSNALDMEPYPRIAKTLREDLTFLGGLYVGIGSTLGYEIRWGGDWDRDGETADNTWDDLFHIEIVRI